MTKKSNPLRVSPRLWLTALAAMLALTGMAASVPQTKTSADSIENFGQVNENYYRGSQPFADDFAQLKRFGIKTVIDLRKDSELEAPEWARSAGM